MKSRRSLFSLFLGAFVLSLVPSFASADEPSLAERVGHKVEDGLVKPLADFESQSHRMTRARPRAHERRVRVSQTTEAFDKAGRPFVAFAVDVRFGSGEWTENDIVGCAYTKSGELFVKRGDEYRPASFLLGKKADPVTGVCQGAPARS